MNNTEINILFSTKNKENTTNILRSLQRIHTIKNNSNYSLSITIFDKTHKQDILNELQYFDLDVMVVNESKILELEDKYSNFLYAANCSLKVDSIQRARIQQQIYIVESYQNFKDSIVWQVDDDVLFGKSSYSNNKHNVEPSFNYFSEIVQFYRQHKNIDAIIAPTSYIPPIPSLLYCKTQLEDFFYREHNPKEAFVSMEYHDYYNQTSNEKDYSLFLSETKDKNEIVKNILIGKPVTKVTINEGDSKKPEFEKSKLLRGGNFIVFNTDIFKIPHLGFSESDTIPARRSDMIHAHLLLELGYNVVDVNFFSLVHNRSFVNSSIKNSTEKYFSDMIGALLIQYVHNGEIAFEKRLHFHQNHIKKILTLLSENVDKGVFKKEIYSLEELDKQINSFNKEHFINEFESFKINKNQLIEKLCKLAS